MIGKIAAALVFAAPSLGFAMYFTFQQIENTNARLDKHEAKFEMQADKFDSDFARARGWAQDPLVEKRLRDAEERAAKAQARIDTVTERAKEDRDEMDEGIREQQAKDRVKALENKLK